MTGQDLEEYQALLTWVKALDAATLAIIQATLASNRRASGGVQTQKFLSSFITSTRGLQPRASNQSAAAG